ncbi:MAG: GYF domain-containing protein [Thermoguttaceae bacterium]|jgi:hypothetical protein
MDHPLSSQRFQYKVMGEKSQPATAAQLRKLRELGTIQRDTLVRRVGDEDWTSADRLAWLFDDAPLLGQSAVEPEPPAAAGETAQATAEPAAEASAESAAAPGDATPAARPSSAPTPRFRDRDGGAEPPSHHACYAGIAFALLLGFLLGLYVGSTRRGPEPATLATAPAAGGHDAKTGQSGTQREPAQPVPEVLMSSSEQEMEARIAAAIKARGGAVSLDVEAPGSPLLSVVFRETTADDSTLAGIEKLRFLEHLSLSRSRITDAGLQRLRRLGQLKSLSLDDSPYVSDAGLEYIKGFTQLDSLSLRKTKITDAGLANLQGLAKLQTLNLVGTRITDRGLASLRDLNNLKTLYLDSTDVTDAGIAELQGLPHIVLLGVSGTHVTKAGAAAFIKAVPHKVGVILDSD